MTRRSARKMRGMDDFIRGIGMNKLGGRLRLAALQRVLRRMPTVTPQACGYWVPPGVWIDSRLAHQRRVAAAANPWRSTHGPGIPVTFPLGYIGGAYGGVDCVQQLTRASAHLTRIFPKNSIQERLAAQMGFAFLLNVEDLICYDLARAAAIASR